MRLGGLGRLERHIQRDLDVVGGGFGFLRLRAREVESGSGENFESIGSGPNLCAADAFLPFFQADPAET